MRVVVNICLASRSRLQAKYSLSFLPGRPSVMSLSAGPLLRRLRASRISTAVLALSVPPDASAFLDMSVTYVSRGTNGMNRVSANILMMSSVRTYLKWSPGSTSTSGMSSCMSMKPNLSSSSASRADMIYGFSSSIAGSGSPASSTFTVSLSFISSLKKSKHLPLSSSSSCQASSLSTPASASFASTMLYAMSFFIRRPGTRSCMRRS